MSSQPPQEPSLGQIKAPPTQNHVRLWRLARNSQYGHLRGWNFQEGQFCTSVATLLFCPNALVKCVLMCFACFCVVITCHVLPCAVALVVCKQYFHKSYERCSYQKKNREMYLYIYMCVCKCICLRFNAFICYVLDCVLQNLWFHLHHWKKNSTGQQFTCPTTSGKQCSRQG